MKKVMAFGTFDRLHKGHEHYLQEAKSHGDYLVVVVARDATVKDVKDKRPSDGEESRRRAVQGLPYVDEAVIGNPGDKHRIIEEHDPDVICLGYDQKAFTEDLERSLRDRRVKARIVRASPYKPEKYKSSKL